MRSRLNISIRQRIYWSFSVLVLLFVINSVVTIITINGNKKSATDIFKVIAPSIQGLNDFKRIIVESKMYTTNWVFLRYNEEDKRSLRKIHDTDYAALKSKIDTYFSQWADKRWTDSLNNVYTGFEELLNVEKKIMTSLKDFKDYDEPAIKLEAERKVEEEVLPRTAALMNSLNTIHNFSISVREKKGTQLEISSMRLRILIIVLTVTIILIGFLFSLYMTRLIIKPVNKIRHLINDLGKGIIRKTGHNGTNNEIGKMISSVNNLSEKLQATATFAHETGLRNFDMPFSPLSDEDTLGKALIAMRENLKAGETNLERKHFELEQKNKELEEFAFVASHDLQEPLRTTSSFVELLQQQYKGRLDEKADKYLSYISQASDRMQVLVSDLLEYSRIGSKKELKLVDCNKVLSEVLADLKVAITETGASISAARLPSICGYETEIKQLFQNLVSNSIKFRKKGLRPSITICAWDHKDHWQFAFSDNGIGIAQQHYGRIFVIFQRLHTRNEYDGSGIGLSHCKKIVELHKGNIWLESKPGQGATFYFTIPKNIN